MRVAPRLTRPKRLSFRSSVLALASQRSSLFDVRCAMRRLDILSHSLLDPAVQLNRVYRTRPLLPLQPPDGQAWSRTALQSVPGLRPCSVRERGGSDPPDTFFFLPGRGEALGNLGRGLSGGCGRGTVSPGHRRRSSPCTAGTGRLNLRCRAWWLDVSAPGSGQPQLVQKEVKDSPTPQPRPRLGANPVCMLHCGLPMKWLSPSFRWWCFQVGPPV